MGVGVVSCELFRRGRVVIAVALALCGAGSATAVDFALPQNTNLISAARFVIPIHLDNDGRIDFVMTSYDGTGGINPGKWNEVMNSPSGALTIRTDRPEGMDITGPRAVVADLTGDGLDDLVFSGLRQTVDGNCQVAFRCVDEIRFYARLPGGGLAPPRVLSERSSGGAAALLAVGDLTGDAMPDLAYVDRTNAVIHLLANDGRGNFTDVGTGDGGFADDIRVADVGGDGKNELIVSRFASPVSISSISILQPIPSGGGTSLSSAFSLTPRQVRPGVAPEINAIAVEDFTNDGLVDVAVSLNENGSGALQVFPGRLEVGFLPSPLMANLGDQPILTRFVGDLDGDGTLDLTAKTAAGIAVASGNGDGTFAAAAAVSLPADAAPLVVDANSDSRNDVVFTNYAGLFPILVHLPNITAFPPPASETAPASNIAKRSLTLNGRAITRRQPGTYRFEYGRTAALGSSTPPVAVPSGRLAQAVAAPLDGLAPGGLYYYRLVVTTPFGTAPGPTLTARTGGLIDAASITPRWEFGRPTGTLTLSALPARAGKLTVEVFSPRAKRPAFRRRNIAFKARQAKLRIPLRSPALHPGNVRVIVKGTDETGTKLTQELVIALRPPKQGWANAYFTRGQGGARLAGPVRSVKELRVVYDFQGSLPVKRTTLYFNSCNAPGARFRPAGGKLIDRGNLVYFVLRRSVRFAPATYTCVLRAGSPTGFPVARTSIRVRR